MSLSSIDFLSPKITLYYNGHNSHISHIGGLLSVLFLIILFLLIYKCLYDIFDPKLNSSIIYEQNSDENKYIQILDYLGINHFIQMYSRSNRGWFGDFDNKNIIIYGIKETNNIRYNNEEDELKIDLYNTEHWLYDKCENILEINKNLFSEISHTIRNYSKSICLRYYYNPLDQVYYEIGFPGYNSPYLETNLNNEKRYIYKIMIEKCTNNSIFTNKMNYNCNNKNEIVKYLNVYNDVFLYFSNNQITPDNMKYPLEKYFDSISSSIQKLSYFENNLVFAPLKIITEKGIFYSKKEDLTFILKSHYHNDKLINKEYTTVGIFNFYFRNNIIIYQRIYFNFIEGLSHLGGIAQLLFFIFQMCNYINNRYTIIENSKNLFKISTGIDTNYADGNEFIFDKMRHLNTQNLKIKVFNNNNIINNDDYNKKFMKKISIQNKMKLKYNVNELYGLGNLANKISKKNFGLMMPIPSIGSNRKKNNYDNKRVQTKYTNTFKQMGKQFTIKQHKRKSFMSQGVLNKKADNSIYSKNHSICDNEPNHEIISNNDNNYNNNSGFLLLKEMREKDQNEILLKNDSRNLDDSIKKNIKKKTNLKKHALENNLEGGRQSSLKKASPSIKGRHKSVNFGNQRDFLFSANLFGLKNITPVKNSSEYVNESSKKMIFTNKNLLRQNSRFQFEKRKFDDNISRRSIANNNNENLNTVIYNNQNNETSNILKNIIQSKIKLVMPDSKQDYILNNVLERKTHFSEFLKFFLICFKRNENKLEFLKNFRNKLLSEEHLYKVNINLYFLEKIFQIDEVYKFNPNELYNNL